MYKLIGKSEQSVASTLEELRSRNDEIASLVNEFEITKKTIAKLCCAIVSSGCSKIYSKIIVLLVARHLG